MVIKTFIEEIVAELNKIENQYIEVVVEEDSEKALVAQIFDNRIVWSHSNFEYTYELVYELLKNNNLEDIASKYFITKCCIAHEIGHFMDITSKSALHHLEYLSNLSLQYEEDNEMYNNIAQEFYDLRIKLEENAWNLSEKIVNFSTHKEWLGFYLIRQFFLNSYLIEK